MTLGEGFITRPATKEDASLLARIHVDAWQAAYRHIVPDSFLERFTYEKRTKAFYEALENQREETYVVQLGEQAVGILTIGSNRDDDLDKTLVGEIWGIYLDPAYWRKSIGTRIVREAEAKLLARRYKELVLWVFRDNWNARKFYQKMGYLPDGKERIHHLDQEVVAIRCRKRFQS